MLIASSLDVNLLKLHRHLTARALQTRYNNPLLSPCISVHHTSTLPFLLDRDRQEIRPFLQTYVLPEDFTMHITTLVTSSLSLLIPLTSAVTLSYDPGYSQSGRSLNVVSCSDGANGLTTRYGYSTQGQIPRFPYIGGSSDIAGWNSPSCGQCYKLRYAATGKEVYILAIDHVAQGFNVAQKAMDELTNNQAVALGRIDVTSTKVGWQNCGLPHAKRGLEFAA